MTRLASYFGTRALALFASLLGLAASSPAAVLRQVDVSLFDSTRSELIFSHEDLSVFLLSGSLLPGTYVFAFNSALTVSTEGAGEEDSGRLFASAEFALSNAPATVIESTSAFLSTDVTGGSAPFDSDGGIPDFIRTLSDSSNAGETTAMADARFRFSNDSPISLSITTDHTAASITPAGEEFADSRARFGSFWEFQVAAPTTFTVSSIAAVPEPGAGLLLASAFSVLAAHRRRRSSPG